MIAASFAPPKPLSATPPVAIASPSSPGPLAQLLVAPKAASAALTESAVVFGTDPDEHAAWQEQAEALLARWSKLHLTLDPSVREVHAGSYGYAIASVSLAKPGAAPLRMTALIIGSLDDKQAWRVDAIHFISP